LAKAEAARTVILMPACQGAGQTTGHRQASVCHLKDRVAGA